VNSSMPGGKGTSEEERNRKAVLDFYEHIVNGLDFSRAPEFLDPEYIQHRPDVTSGPEGVLNFMREQARLTPNQKVEVVRSFVDGDYVILHVHVHLMPVLPDRAVMDIFRCKDGKLMEHWDVDREVPPPEAFAHSNGMF
jgi:predicted SnoaL-like aldol condensation-catalyzing enzyme